MTAQPKPLSNIPGGVEAFLAAYYVHVPPDELAEQGEAHTRAVVSEHAALGDRRTPGQTLARAYPLESDAGSRIALDVVTDDMPFLVDSLTAIVSRLGCAITWLLHPQLAVRRDEDGTLREMVGSAA